GSPMFSHPLLVKTFMIAAVGASTLAPLAARAGEVGSRVENQHDRLAQGVRSGQLTRGEFARDQSRLHRVNAQRHADLRANGGHLTSGETAKLNRELNRNSNNIYFTKHNRADQPGV
ncbi:MAG: hypothetical protein ACREM6_03930, partial [Vulcanimicrobiaceae bacterium]